MGGPRRRPPRWTRRRRGRRAAQISYHSEARRADLRSAAPRRARTSGPGGRRRQRDHHPPRLEEGRWFTEADSDGWLRTSSSTRRSWTRRGRRRRPTHPTVVIGARPGGRHRDRRGARAVERRGAAASCCSTRRSAGSRRTAPSCSPTGYRFWVPPDADQQLPPRSSGCPRTSRRRGRADQRTCNAAGLQVDVQDTTSTTACSTGCCSRSLGVGGFALLLGGLGLLNIALVTVRYRIREIGIRRSFGATGGRVFFGVLMESVVATRGRASRCGDRGGGHQEHPDRAHLRPRARRPAGVPVRRRPGRHGVRRRRSAPWPA